MRPVEALQPRNILTCSEHDKAYTLHHCALRLYPTPLCPKPHHDGLAGGQQLPGAAAAVEAVEVIQPATLSLAAAAEDVEGVAGRRHSVVGARLRGAAPRLHLLPAPAAGVEAVQLRAGACTIPDLSM